MKSRTRFDAGAEEVAQEATPSWNDRFWSKVDKDGPKQPHMETRCWVWIGGTTSNGYGMFWVEGRLRSATHVAFFLKHGRWPKPCALHKCDQPGCIRWGHLFEGTKQDNADDMICKGRQRHLHGEDVPTAKLTEADARRIRSSLGSSREVAHHFGISHTQVQYIRRGKNWSHL